MDEKLEKRFEQLAENRIASRNYKLFDKNSRVIKRQRLAELKLSGKTENDLCLVIINAEGETIILTEEFERELFRIDKGRYNTK